MSHSSRSPPSNVMEDYRNVIRPFGYSNMECGYCKGRRANVISKTSEDCSKAFGMLADSMTPEAYEAFLYRGWRRSGIHLYKPCNFESCCPTLTIRLLVDSFRPTKSQSKIQRKLQNMLQKPEQKNNPQAKPSSKTKSKGISLSQRLESYLLQTPGSAQIFDALEKATRQGLLETAAVADKALIPTISYKVRPPTKSQEKQRQISLVSNACAQMAGQARIPRDPLLLSVVKYLQQQTFSSDENINDNSFRIVSMESHTKSGQIVVSLQCSEKAWQQAYHTMPAAVDEDTSMRDTDDNNDDNNDGDKLAKWYQATMGKPLQPHERKLRMETISAHQSALDPRVHELYLLYQNAVHQDPDPLQATEQNKMHDNNENDDSEDHDDEMETLDDVNGREPDTISLEEHPTNGDVPLASLEDGLKSSRPDPIEAIDHLDWGPHHPSYFREQVVPMLRAYLAPHSKPVQRALLNNYFSFYQFLVESPFDSSTPTSTSTSSYTAQQSNHTSPDCGTYHQQYWIGDALIAVGVVDVLPNGLSSVYLYYHPSFSHQLVALGKLAILKEIEYTREVLQKPYYYLGYYIESCQKMRYKADYQPSQLLCPVHYRWVDSSIAIPKLQQVPQHVCVLVEEDPNPDGKDQNAKKEEQNRVSETVLSTIPMDIGANMTVRLDMLQDDGKQIVRPILHDLCREAGQNLSRKCLVKLT